jgi:hypothetical protein
MNPMSFRDDTFMAENIINLITVQKNEKISINVIVPTCLATLEFHNEVILVVFDSHFCYFIAVIPTQWD